ncbi:hypothetical protein AMQ83_12795, partial [Paenibacillus riograndensis]
MESPHAIKGTDAMDSLLSAAKTLADQGAIRDEIVSGLYGVSAGICREAVTSKGPKNLASPQNLDRSSPPKIQGS